MENNNSYTITETYTLPSKGLIYSNQFNPNITLRSMTTRDEMRRQSDSQNAYRVLCDVIEDCIVSEKLPVHVYDMALSDYQFLLYKLRVVTYGSNYKMTVRCPICGNIQDSEINLDDLEIKEFDEQNYQNLRSFELPVTKKKIELNYITPRMQDSINQRVSELTRKTKGVENASNPSLMITLAHLIKTVDGKSINPVELEVFIQNLPMKDTNYILKKVEKFNRELGINTVCSVKCNRCGYDILTTFRFTQEFFGPSID